MRSKEIEDFIKSLRELKIYGQGTRRGLGNLSAKSFTHVQHYAPNELYITIGAGMGVDELNHIIAQKGQRLACEVQDHRVIFPVAQSQDTAPTIGGAIGLNAYGSGRLRYGMLRDAVLGLRIYDGQGVYLRTGGIVMKNVTGLDLTKFFVGSRGRLGLATEVTLKLLPKPFSQMALRLEMPLEEARAQMGAILRQPLDIFAAQYQDGALFLRLEGKDLESSKMLINNQWGASEECDVAIWEDLRDWKIMQNAQEIWRVFAPSKTLFDLAKYCTEPYAVLQGGQELIISENPQSLFSPNSSQETHQIFALCEKGTARGAVWPERSDSHEALRKQLRKVFDPEEKFGDNP